MLLASLFMLVVSYLILNTSYFIPLAHAAVSDSGLVGYWSMDEGTSTIAHDFSGNKNNGTLTGSTLPSWVNGKLGKAISFNGSNYVSITSGPYLNYRPVTFALWIKESSSQYGTFMIGKSGYGGFLRDYGDGRYEWDIYSGGENNIFANIPSYNQWHFVVGTYDGTTQILYIDGISAASQALNVMPGATSDFGIGSCPFCGPGQFTTGQIDEVRVYNRALSATDVNELYQRGAAKFTNAVSNLGLVGYWSMDEGTSTIAHDFSGNKNNGTINGTATWISGKLGKALSFNGSTNVDMGTGMAGTFPAMTISAWVNPSSFASWRAIVQTANAGDRALYLQDNHVQLYSSCNSTGTVSSTGWTFVTATIDGSDNIIYYINGSSSGGCNSGSHRVVEYLHISGINTGDSENFVGSIDDVRVYNRALSATEVAQLYTLGAGSKVAVSTAQPTGLTSGLAGWWTFDGPKMIPNVIDSSGLGNNGNLAGATTTVPGKIGQALSFNGGSDSVLLSSSISTGGTNNWSVSAWTKTTNSGVNSVLSNSSGGPVTNDLRIDTSKIAYYHYDGSWKEEFGTSNIADGRWHNLIWVNSNNQTINLYVDGNLENNGAPSATTNNGPVNQIGRNWSLSATAAIDDVRVYNRALSASEVAQLYTMGK